MYFTPFILDVIHWCIFVFIGVAVIGMLFRELSSTESNADDEDER